MWTNPVVQSDIQTRESLFPLTGGENRGDEARVPECARTCTFSPLSPSPSHPLLHGGYYACIFSYLSEVNCIHHIDFWFGVIFFFFFLKLTVVLVKFLSPPECVWQVPKWLLSKLRNFVCPTESPFIYLLDRDRLTWTGESETSSAFPL